MPFHNAGPPYGWPVPPRVCILILVPVHKPN